jgi:hypothetical protein
MQLGPQLSLLLFQLIDYFVPFLTPMAHAEAAVGKRSKWARSFLNVESGCRLSAREQWGRFSAREKWTLGKAVQIR